MEEKEEGWRIVANRDEGHLCEVLYNGEPVNGVYRVELVVGAKEVPSATLTVFPSIINADLGKNVRFEGRAELAQLRDEFDEVARERDHWRERCAQMLPPGTLPDEPSS